MNVTRRPFSFHGAEIASNEDQSWAWGDGLSIYAGDMVIDKLRQFIPHAQMLRDDPMRALQDPTLVNALQMLGQMTGRAVDVEGLKATVRLAEKSPNTPKLKARGKEISTFDAHLGVMARAGLSQLGTQVGIEFDFKQQFAWHPIDAQRLLLWAAQRGQAELLAEELAVLHFTQNEGSCLRSTVTEAAHRAGLEMDEVNRFLNSEELRADVWKSYSDMVEKHQIHSIPMFIFHGPRSNGGHFRPKKSELSNDQPRTVNGSAHSDDFLQIFEELHQEYKLASQL